MREETALQRALIARACAADDGLPLSQAADLLDRLNTVLSGITHLTAVSEQARQVAEVAARRGDRPSEALARYVSGNALWHANAFPDAETLPLFRTLNVSSFEAASGNLIAELHAEEERYALAAQTAETFLPLARKVSAMLPLHRLDRHEERPGDVPVAQALDGEGRHSSRSA